MKTRLVFIALLISSLIVGVGNLPAASLVGEEHFREKTAEIVDAEARHDLFSGAVLLAKNGEIVYAKGFGHANKEHRIPNSLETQFNISSIQKTFIATTIMQLHQERKIALDDPLKKHFPDCPWETADQIQIRHLLNHTSGLGDYRDNEEYQANSERYTCIDDVLPLVYKQEPAFAPGERFRYSNAGVLLLKAIIERVEGMGLAPALQRRIFDPVGMDGTALFRGGDLLPHRATAYTLTEDAETYRRVLGEPSAYAGGGIYTSVVDLLEFDQALYGERLLSDENKRVMFTPVEASPNYAYGWGVVQHGDTTVVLHGGGSGGFSSMFRRYPEIGYTLVVLSNYGDAAFGLADKIESMLLGRPYLLATEADLFYRRGMIFQAQGDHARAIETFRKNIERKAPHLPSLYQSARSRILGEFEQEQAIELLDAYIKHATDTTRPSIAAAWWRKGVAYEQIGRTSRAIDCHKKSLELDPGFEYAQEALARLAPEGQ